MSKTVKFKILPVNHFNLDDPRLKKGNVIPVPEVFVESYFSKAPYLIKYGSRFSGKSWDECKRQLLLCAGGPEGDNYYRGIFARMTKVAARNSQFQLFKDTLKRYPLLNDQFEVRETPMKIIHKDTGNYIQGGSFEDTESLMSVPDLTHFWSEEPINRSKSLESKQFVDISGTLRNSQGIIPQFSMTFNPINKSNFVFTDFFDKKLYDAHIIKANYYDNPFCPEDRIAYLEKLKIADPTRYLVDGKGEFGTILTGSEYYGNFSKAKHVQRGDLLPLPIHITQDYNVVPYMTCIINQVYLNKRTGKITFHALDEFTVSPPNSTIKHTADAVLAKWEPHIRKHGCFYYGDPTAKNRTVIYEARDLRQNIIKHFRGYVTPSNMRFSRSARRHKTVNNRMGRWDLFAKLFSDMLQAEYLISPQCKKLIEDYESVQVDANGGKSKKKTKVNGIMIEKYGHTSDAQDYFIGWQMKYQFNI